MFLKMLKEIRCKLLLINKRVSIGKNSTFGRGTVFYAPQNAIIRNNVYIGKYCSLETDFEIADNVVIGNNVGIIGKYDHDFTCIGKTIKDAPWIGDKDYQYKGKNLSVRIEEDVWIGFGAVILSGVTVGRGSIVAAGSTVTKDVEPYSIVAGNPAVKKGMRFTPEEIEKHEKILYS